MTAVAHLVWGPLGPDPLRAFLASYREHPAGEDHELVVILNGVQREHRRALLEVLDGVEHRLLTLDRPVQDLEAYALAAASLDHERLCFMNSYASILADGWLSKLERALDGPGVGLVGATGSWASLRSWTMHLIHLPSPYRAVVPERAQAFAEFEQIDRELRGERAAEEAGAEFDSGGAPRAVRAARAQAERLVSTAEQLARFGSFPTPHLRTNAFLVSAALFRQLRTVRLRRKMDAYSLESGRRGITAQVLRAGARALVVDRDGVAYEAPDWPASRTFWQADQERLLVADNQTRIYSNGSMARRRLLAALAWGAQAAPVAAHASDRLDPGSSS